MALGYTWRKKFPNQMARKFNVYWHAMHPVDFKFTTLYRAGFTDKEYKALKLLMDRRSDCVSGGYNFQVYDKENNWKMVLDLPKKYEDWPGIKVNAEDFDPQLRGHLTQWCETSKRYEAMRRKLCRYLSDALATDCDRRSLNGLNTERQLYAFWPELLPFFSEEWRDTIRNTKVRPQLPKEWADYDTNYVETFFAQEQMEEINYALSVIQLLPKKTDEHYPSVY